MTTIRFIFLLGMILVPPLLSADTPKEVWSKVVIDEIQFRRAPLEEVLIQLNRIVQKTVKIDDVPKVWLDAQDPSLPSLPDGLTRDQQELVTHWRDHFVKEHRPHWPPRPVTLYFRDVTAYEALQVVVEISGLCLEPQERGFRISREHPSWTVMRIPTPRAVKPIADEVLSDVRDENLWGLFRNDSSGFGPAPNLLKPLTRDQMIFIGAREEGKRIRALAVRDPGWKDMTAEDLDLAFLFHNPEKIFPAPKEVEVFMEAVQSIDWTAEWRAYERRFEEAQREVIPNRDLKADPFGFEEIPRVNPPAPGIHIQRNYDVLEVKMTGSEKFDILYSFKREPGKYFSETLERITRGAPVTNEAFADLVVSFLQKNRKAVLELLEK